MGPKRVNELPKIVMSMCDGAHNQHIECNMVKIMENKTKVGDVPNVALEEIHKKGVRIGYVLGLVFAAFAAYITHVMG